MDGKVVLVTGAARCLGKIFALACVRAGADVVIHHTHSEEDVEFLRKEILDLGCNARVFKVDFSDPSQAGSLIPLSNEITSRILNILP